MHTWRSLGFALWNHRITERFGLKPSSGPCPHGAWRSFWVHSLHEVKASASAQSGGSEDLLQSSFWKLLSRSQLSPFHKGQCVPVFVCT